MKKLVLKLIITVLTLCFWGSFLYLLQVIQNYYRPQILYNKLEHAASNNNSNSFDAPNIDFNYLESINSDTKAWIFIPNTSINYPITLKDNKYYLTHSINKDSSIAGCLFFDTRNKCNPKKELHSIIYGHNMKDGTMFASLNQYQSLKYWKKHPYFYLCTPGTPQKTYQYKIFSTYLTPAEDTSDFITTFNSIKEYKKFLANITNKSEYDTKITPSIKSKIVTLSTCTTQDKYRRVVHAYLISEN